MGKKRDVTVSVHGIRYEEFAGLKWRQFLRGFSLAVALLVLLVLLVLIMVLTGRLPREVPTPVALAVLLVALGSLAVYRSAIRRSYRASGLGSMELSYTFDRDGWTVRQGDAQVRVLWSKTWRVRRNDRALLLYPGRKSVNLVPLRDMTGAQLEQILAWVRGERKKI